MRTWFLGVVGVAAIAGWLILGHLHAGEIPVHFYLPSWPIVSQLDQALEQENPAPGVSSSIHLTIPRIHVDGQLETLTKTADGQLQTPAKWEDAGWYDGSSQPGNPGVTVVFGHVDSHVGPAVFFGLHELQPGDTLQLTTNGHRLTYRVDTSQSYGENEVPLDRIFTASGPNRVALLTCSGDFNPRTERYNERLVVTASLAEST